MDWIIPEQQLQTHLLTLERSFLDPIALCHEAIQYCGEVLEDYREKVMTSGFPDRAAEIQFFKRDKAKVLGQMLCYQKRLELALSHPQVAWDRDVEAVASQLKLSKAFLSHHRAMVQYLRLDGTALDPHYFLRENRKESLTSHYSLPHFDPRFSTSHDGLVAHIWAHQHYQKFLIQLLQRPVDEGLPTGMSPLQWTDTKIALMEMILTVHLQGSINKGTPSLKELVRYFQIWFNIDLGDPYHLAMRLRNRSEPTKYLNLAAALIQEHIEELES